MRYSEIKRGFSPEEAANYLGSKDLLRRMQKRGWIKPFIKGNRLTRFDIKDLDLCIDRLKSGEVLNKEDL